MRDSEKTQTLTRVIKRNTFQDSRENSEKDETAKHCNMFIIGAAVFFAGFWAVACLTSAILQNGPVKMLRNMATAVTGF